MSHATTTGIATKTNPQGQRTQARTHPGVVAAAVVDGNELLRLVVQNVPVVLCVRW